MKSISLYIFLFSASILSWACDGGNKTIKHVTDSYPDGSPKIIKYYKKYDEGEAIVKIERFSPAHKKQMENKFIDAETNVLTLYYDNGKPWMQTTFKNNRRNGKEIVWYENGQKKSEGTYENDQRTGKWIYYDERGEIINTKEQGK